MGIKKAVPHLFTSMNLLSGCVGIILAFHQELFWSSVLIGCAALFDFVDGLAARLLKVQSNFGKELDSLADMVTFGLLPGIMMWQFINIGFSSYFVPFHERPTAVILWSLVALLIPIFSALRLANFNIDTRQSDSFIGLPTPACAMFVASIPLIMEVQFNLNMYHPIVGDVWADVSRMYYWDVIEQWVVKLLFNPYFFVGLAITLSALLVAPVKLLALKFKNLSWADNKIRYIFLGTAFVGIWVAILPFFNIKGISYTPLGFIMLPIVLVLYVLLSIVNNILKISE